MRRKDLARSVREALAQFLSQEAKFAEKGDIAVALDYIHEHLLDEGLNVAQVLRSCRVHSHRFAERFADEVGVGSGVRLTPHDYIQWARIRIALLVLEEGNSDLTGIAYAVGFRSYSTFYRAFHRQIGMSPTAFRRRTAGRNCK